ncbi:fungal-specific transcription factor domain-containing protein [Aspergillus carlsbadensis]|nr:fungal-specific transcription factor domain-containing protein [Aspergillus carlsbadensis]
MIPQSSTARLRTRSGCAECRRRRKKCDEKRPLCGGCVRNGLECKWLSETQFPDRRRNAKPSEPPATDEMAPCSTELVLTRGLSPVITMPEPFHTEEHVHLYRYFASSIMPRLVRQTSLSRYSVDAHLLRLALGHAPLLGALVSIAAMWTVPRSKHQSSLAVKCYLFAINSLKKGITDGALVGNEDWLLATTTLLCLFENTRYDSLPNPGCHVQASGRILSLRTPKPRNSSQELLVFERVCIESFVYHAALTSLFDSSIDCNSIIPSDLDFNGYFCDPAHPSDLGSSASPSTQPVLGAPYKFFVLLADLVQLARTSLMPGANYVREWARLQDEFLQAQWNRNSSQNGPGDSIETLYTVCIAILLLLTDHQPTERFLASFETLLSRGLRMIAGLQIDTWFSYYYLWPLLLIGSVAVNKADRNVVTEKVVRASETRQTGPVLLARKQLELVWKEGDQYEQFGDRVMITAQFRALLE